MKKISLPGLVLILGLTACNQDIPPADNHADAAMTQCADPRPEICTFEYNPVCGLQDTGIRCVTTPCPSEEWRTYGNACSACADEKVSGYKAGACEQEN